MARYSARSLNMASKLPHPSNRVAVPSLFLPFPHHLNSPGRSFWMGMVGIHAKRQQYKFCIVCNINQRQQYRPRTNTARARNASMQSKEHAQHGMSTWRKPPANSLRPYRKSLCPGCTICKFTWCNVLHAKCWCTWALLRWSEIIASDRCASRALGAFETYACQFGTTILKAMHFDAADCRPA